MRHHRHRHFPADARHLSLLPPPASDAPPEVHWRHRRNIVIYLLRRQGVPYQLIADAFDLGIVQTRNIIAYISKHDRSLTNQAILRPRAGATRQFVGEVERGSTPLRRWRARRDAIMRLAYRIGLSRELIADVFDLGRSAVNAVLKGTARAATDQRQAAEGQPSGSA
jgi:hypothetical protein